MSLAPLPPSRMPVPPVPQGACDSQAHLVADPAAYPRRTRHTDLPAGATFSDLKKLHRSLGIGRGVLVTSLNYHPDNSIVFDALKDGKDSGYRGIALVTRDLAIEDRQLETMRERGFCGIRLNYWPGFDDVPDAAGFGRMVSRIRHLGWHVKIHVIREGLLPLIPMIARCSIPVVLDHMCHVDPSKGVTQPVVQAMLALLKHDHIWVMLSCYERNSHQDAKWRDFRPIIEALLAAAPDRLIWGTDWPHLGFQKTRMPADVELVEALYDYVPDIGLRQKILVSNPARLFHFPSQT